jgi:VanZ family protein
MLELRHRGLWLAASTVLVAIVVWGSLETGTELPFPGGYDKVEHFGTYLVLALWFMGLFRRAHFWAVASVLVLLGFSMELFQYLMHAGREADARDMAANSGGIALGSVVALLLSGEWAAKVEAWLS